MMNQKILGVALIVGMVVSGCGGGGSGGGSVGGEGALSLGLSEGVTNSGNSDVDVVMDAAQSIPRAGSVTQSSNTDSAGVTRDTMNVTAGYAGGGLTLTGTYDENGDGAPVTIGTADADYVESIGSDQDICSQCDNSAAFSGRTWNGAFLGKRLGSEILLAAFYTDLQDGDSSGTDHMALGVWLSGPEAVLTGQSAPGNNDIQFGTFADLSNPFPQAGLAGLTGTATYQGDAIGIYALQQGSDGGPFYADVELTASFGGTSGLGSVTGTVSGFQILEEESLVYAPLQMLSLGTAPITADAGGFFRGSTSGTDSDGASYSGRWGGMFAGDAGDDPTSVGGTFGAATSNGFVNFVGAFGAYKQ